MYGKIEMGLILLYCLLYLIIIILATAFNNKKIVIYMFNLIQRKWESFFRMEKEE